MSSKRPKLTPTQGRLLDAMQRGVVVHWLSGLHAHAFRADVGKKVTTTIHALRRLGLVYHEGFHGVISLTPAGKGHTP